MAAGRTRVDAARQLGHAGRLDRSRSRHRLRAAHRSRGLARATGLFPRHRRLDQAGAHAKRRGRPGALAGAGGDLYRLRRRVLHRLVQPQTGEGRQARRAGFGDPLFRLHGRRPLPRHGPFHHQPGDRHILARGGRRRHQCRLGVGPLSGVGAMGAEALAAHHDRVDTLRSQGYPRSIGGP